VVGKSIEKHELSEKSYLRMKTQADQIRYEFTNRDTIVLRSSGMYYKAMGNSAVLLKGMGSKTKIRSSFDPVTKQDVLELSIHAGRIDDTKKYLKEKSELVLRDDKRFYIVRLKNPMSAKELKKFKNSDELKSDLTEDILNKHRKETQMAKEVRDIFQEAAILVRTMGAADAALGRMLFDELLTLYIAVRALMREKGKKEETWIAVDDAADNVQGLLLLTPDFAKHAGRLGRMGRSLNKIRLEADTEKAIAANAKFLDQGLVKKGKA